MKRRACLALAFLAGVGLLIFGGSLHEEKRTIRFVGLTDGQRDVHPARAIEVAFQRPPPKYVTVVLTTEGHTIPTISIPTQDDPSRLLVRAIEPLKWASSYKLCVLRQRRHFVQVLLGPRRSCISFRSQEKPQPSGAPDEPILIASGRDSLFSSYYGQILKAEGFESYATEPADDLTADSLKYRSVVILASSHTPPAMVATLSEWVNAGGLLIAMRPGPELYSLLGFKPYSSGTIRAASLLAADDVSFTRGIAASPLRLHGPIDLLSISNGSTDKQTDSVAAPHATNIPEATTPRILAHLTERHGTLLPYPAATIIRHGRGHAAAFVFSVAKSVVSSRQGNFLWADEERDGSPPRRPNDLFYPDYVDFEDIDVPQADELQRLFANIIVASSPQPVPRFWYLPDKRRAVVIAAGDDHATRDGTPTLFARLNANSTPECRLDRWECLRATSYMTPNTKLTPKLAEYYSKLGFELGVHVDSGCKNHDDDSLAQIVRSQMDGFHATYPVLPKQETLRIHCIVWNGWVNLPRIERQNGIRLDMNYYYWPPDWLQQRPGFMTGSGFPMPYVDENGLLLDTYQAATQLVNQDGVPQKYGISVMLDRALGDDEYFGAFGTHFDFTDDFSEQIINAAAARGIALITARQMLEWLDGRNGSRFRNMRWNGKTLGFTIDLRPGADHASIMLPETFKQNPLAAVVCSDEKRQVTHQKIKGIDYGFFQAMSGRCEAQYGLAAFNSIFVPSTKPSSKMHMTLNNRSATTRHTSMVLQSFEPGSSPG